MKTKNFLGHLRCFGSATVNSKGQVVIPASARKELGIANGDTLLVFRALPKRGLLLFKADDIQFLLSRMGENLARLQQLVREHSPEAAKADKEG